MKTDSIPKTGRRNLGLIGLYYFIIEPLAGEIQLLFLGTFVSRSPKTLFSFLRYLRYILKSESYCGVCGQRVKENWIPTINYLIDPILDETAKPLDPIYIGCKYCDPFFEAKSIYGDLIVEENVEKFESWKSH